jgi:multidrug efflux pump subunit AcrA (membrane-fusion protein)
MITRYLIPLLAVAGLLFGIFMVVRGAREVEPARPLQPPPKSPFEQFIAASGLVESSTENIAIGSPVGDVVMRVFVKVGDRVREGDPLFELDDRVLQAELLIHKANVEAAQAELARLKASPRKEEIPPLEARVREEEANLAQLKALLEIWESIKDPRAVSREEIIRRRTQIGVGEARVADAKARLALLKAGSWSEDIKVAQARLDAAVAQVDSVALRIARLTVRAPKDGQVLQLNIRPGEFASAGVLSRPLVVMGGTRVLHVRADIDENDAWRFNPQAPAIAYARGNRNIATPLTYVYTEPLVVPKRSLTGESTERVDTRVLQVIYAFDPDKVGLYVGQQVDLFIKSQPAGDIEGAAQATQPAQAKETAEQTEPKVTQQQGAGD